jgi:hypothetical protein
MDISAPRQRVTDLKRQHVGNFHKIKESNTDSKSIEQCQSHNKWHKTSSEVFPKQP